MKEIKLTQGHVALVDDEDFDNLSKYKWFAMTSGKGFRVCTTIGYGRKGRKSIYMHHLLIGKIESLHLDHINGNSLDNQKNNLRWATTKDNIRNSRKKEGTSKYKGVCWYKNRWVATITVDRKSIYLGRFIDEKQAAEIYKQAANKYFGEFARTPGV